MIETYQFTKAKIAAERAARRKQTLQRGLIYLVSGIVGVGVGYLVQGNLGALVAAIVWIAFAFGFEIINGR